MTSTPRRLEAGVDPLRVPQAAQEQRRCDERDQRQRDLRNHQRLPQIEDREPAAPARSARNGLVLQHGDDVRPRCLDGRGQAEEHAGREREQRGEKQHAPVERQIVDPPAAATAASPRPGHRAASRPGAIPACRRAPRAARFPSATAARGDRARRRAPAGWRSLSAGAFARASSRLAMFAQAMSSTMPTTLIRIIEICTTWAPPWPSGFRRASSSDRAPRAASLVVVGEGLLELREDGPQVRARLLEADARLQPAEREEEQAASLLVPVEVRLDDVVHRHRHPDGRAAAEESPGESPRRDADDRERRPVQRQRPPDDGGIAAQAALPEAMADDRDRRRPAILSGRKPRPSEGCAPSSEK